MRMGSKDLLGISTGATVEDAPPERNIAVGSSHSKSEGIPYRSTAPTMTHLIQRQARCRLAPQYTAKTAKKLKPKGLSTHRYLR